MIGKFKSFLVLNFSAVLAAVTTTVFASPAVLNETFIYLNAYIAAPLTAPASIKFTSAIEGNSLSVVSINSNFSTFPALAQQLFQLSTVSNDPKTPIPISGSGTIGLAINAYYTRQDGTEVPVADQVSVPVTFTNSVMAINIPHGGTCIEGANSEVAFQFDPTAITPTSNALTVKCIPSSTC